MAMTTTNGNPSFLRDQVGELIVRPVQTQSIALQASTVVNTAEAEHQFRVPIVASDPTASWTKEGAEITPSDGDLDEATTAYFKLAGLTIISRELADDSSPAAAQIVGAGLARDISRKLDAAFFSNTTTNGPAGLESITASTVTTAATTWGGVDEFTEALFDAENVGASLTNWIANPADALALSQLKEGTASNRDLLQPDPTAPGVRRIAGVPMLVSSAVTPGTVWGIPRSRIIIALRDDVTLDVDRSAYFSSDRVGIRATLRIGWVFPHEAAVEKISLKSA